MRKLVAALPLLLAWGCGPRSTTGEAAVSQPVQTSTPPTTTPNTTSGAGAAQGPSSTSPDKSAPSKVFANSVSNPPVNSDPKSKDSYLPMQDGNEWLYDADITISTEGQPDQPISLELAFKLTDVKHIGDKTQATLAVYEGDVLIDKSIWQETPTSITQLASGLKATPFSSPEPVMNLPVTENQLMHWSNSGYMPNSKPGSQVGKTAVSTAAQIDTAVSTVAGVSSTVTSTFNSNDGPGTSATPGSSTTTTWFQPGVGIVRMVQTVVQEPAHKAKTTNVSTLRLKSWTLQH